jgi:hypothetical protein
MANQAIALQARAPQQGNILAPAIQQGSQMINMMRQQQALDRQAATAEQQMEIARAGEGRAVAGETRAVAKAALEREADIYVKYRREAPIVAEGGPAAYASYLQRMSVDNPEGAARLSQAMPVDRFDKDTFTRMIMGADEYAAARYGKAIIKEFITPEGDVMGANISGFPGATYATPVPDISQPRAPAAPAPAPGVQPMAAPQTPAPAASGMFQPISAPGGQPQGADPQAALLASLTEAKQTGQIGADVVEQLYQMAGPQSTAAVDQFLQANRIQVAGGGMRSAVYRPEGNAMAAQQVQYDPNAYAPVRVKSPMASPLPGSASVPIDRVAAEARAGRQTPQEAYDIKIAEARAARDVGPKPLTAVQEAKLRTNIAKDHKTAESTIDAMTNPVSGVLAAVKAVRDLTPDQKEAITGYSGYLPSVTGASKTADTKLKNLIGKVTALGKAQAALSGAIGPMAVQEWKIVRDLIADLEVTGMGAKDLDDQLDIIESAAQGAADRVRDTYLNQYAEEFERYPNRFQLKDPQAAAKPAAGAGKKPALDSFYKGN